MTTTQTDPAFSDPSLRQDAERFAQDFARLKTELHRVIVGQDEIVEGVLVALFAGGHVLLEGVPGLGNTMRVRTLADALDLRFSRVQFTPDLMPADIVGTNIILEDEHGRKRFQFQPGPVFANVLLADEINRATPKTQSALLEAMQESSVTVSGVVRRLDEPFLVLATQNPLEMEGTYPLPEAQLDRFFFKLKVPYPTAEELHVIADRTTAGALPTVEKTFDAAAIARMRQAARAVPLTREVQAHAIALVLATHPEQQPQASPSASLAQKYVRYGASPRGVQTLILAAKIFALLDGRFHVARADLRRAALPGLRHRIILNFEGEAEGIDSDAVINEILARADTAGQA